METKIGGGEVIGEFVAVPWVGGFEGGELRAFEVRGSNVAIAKVDGEFHAFGDECTHGRCSLAEGISKGTTVICPCHGSEFDVRSGAVLRGPAREPVESYEVRVEGEKLKIKGR